MDDLITLAMESSCDETSVAILKGGRRVLSNVVSSQIDIHKRFGGVVPEVASRKHVESVNSVIEEALKEANMGFSDIDVIAVTYGPGLVGALLVGLSSAKALSFALQKPLVGVHHIEGHIAANFIAHQELEPPFVCLVVSGGHTHLVEVKDYGEFNIIGKTRDDAAGEAYDKVARSVGLGYPGGPLIDKIAKEGNKEAIDFPRVYLDWKDGNRTYDFSFSGLKSAVLNYLNGMKMKNLEINVADVAASFQASVVEVLTEKTIFAARELGYDKIALAGGVASNSALRESMSLKAEKNGMKLYFPPLDLCTDNAAMIGCAGYYEFKKGRISDLSLNAVPGLKLGEK